MVKEIIDIRKVCSHIPRIFVKKLTLSPSTLLRQFKGSDGINYQWCYRSVKNHEWAVSTFQPWKIRTLDLNILTSASHHKLIASWLIMTCVTRRNLFIVLLGTC